MSEDEPQQRDVIDLTGDELPENPLAQPLNTRLRVPKRRRLGSTTAHRSADGFEITEVTVRPPRSQSTTRFRKANLLIGDGIGYDVTQQNKLSAQEKLERIRQQHLVGKPVQLPRSPRVQRAGVQSPHALHPYLRMPGATELASVFGRIFTSAGSEALDREPHMHWLGGPIERDVAPLLNLLSHPGQRLEDEIYRRALQHSLDSVYTPSSMDPGLLKLPPEAGPASDGFTRNVSGGEILVCIRCEQELGVATKGEDSSQRVFARGCGHVYCGRCTFQLQRLKRNKACPHPKCSAVSKNKKNLFREIYI